MWSYNYVKKIHFFLKLQQVPHNRPQSRKMAKPKFGKFGTMANIDISFFDIVKIICFLSLETFFEYFNLFKNLKKVIFKNIYFYKTSRKFVEVQKII